MEVLILTENELAILQKMGEVFDNLEYHPYPDHDRKYTTIEEGVEYSNNVEKLLTKIGHNHKYTF